MRETLITIIFIFPFFLFSQISLEKDNSIQQSIEIVESQVEVKFNYSQSAISVDAKIGVRFVNASLNDFLQHLYQHHQIKYTQSNGVILLFPEKEKRVKYISGYVRDSLTKEPLIFATIYNAKSRKGTTTNEYGYYVINTIDDNIELIVSYVGYKKVESSIALSANQNHDFYLSNVIQLDEYKVIDYKENSINENGKTELTSSILETPPMLKGENDPLQTISLFPGVISEEDNGYLNIRGGNIGENMVLVDGVPIYQMSHFKKLSIINGDVINKATLYKSNFPTRYNGRTSSIIDLRLKNGNEKKLMATGTIGFQTAKFMLDGPLGKKVTFVTSARRNYGAFFDEILGKPINYRSFYDLYGKLNYNTKNGNISVSGFYTQDKSRLTNLVNVFGRDTIVVDTSQFNSQNFSVTNKSYSGMGSIQWNKKWRNRFFTNYQLSFYDYAVQSSKENDTSELSLSNSHIQDIIFNAHHELKTDNHNISFGLNGTYHNLFSIFETDTTFLRDNQVFNELYWYFQDHIRINEEIDLTYGVNLVSYFIGDTIKSLQSLWSFDPRLNMNYSLNENNRLSFSYSRMSQYVHLIPFNLTNGLYQSEIWQASTKNYLPTHANHFSLSFQNKYFKQFPITIETYFKYQKGEKNVQESDLDLLFFGIQSNSFNGLGSNYGLEFMLQKKGRLSGWFSYSLSRSVKKFDEINQGKRFLSEYDRRTLVNIVLNYKLSKKFSINGSWQFKGGRPFYEKYNSIQAIDSAVASGVGSLKYTDVTTNELLQGNYWRYPSYHEFNLQITYSKEKKWGIVEWQLGMKNLFVNKEYFGHVLTYQEKTYRFIFNWESPQIFFDHYPYLTYRFKIK